MLMHSITLQTLYTNTIANKLENASKFILFGYTQNMLINGYTLYQRRLKWGEGQREQCLPLDF